MPWKCKGTKMYKENGGKWHADRTFKSPTDCEKSKRWLYANYGKHKKDDSALAKGLMNGR